MQIKIPQAAPSRRINRFRQEIDAAVSNVIGSDQYVLGSAVSSFETAFSKYVGCSDCVTVASGTDALALSMRALGIGRGDEVITTALTFSGTALAILHCGATPHFVDVNLATYCIDPDAIRAGINSRTAAILPVHLFGHPCDMNAIMEIASGNGLAVIEDCAQAHGAKLDGKNLGTFGNAAAYSFYPTKNLGAMGDGGAVLTNDPDLTKRLRRLRNYGFDGRDRVSTAIGFNSRLDEIQAAILEVLLLHLDDGNIDRRTVADRYRTLLRGHAIGLPPDNSGSIYHQFAVRHDNRDALMQHLAQNQIDTSVHYAPAVHKHPVFATGPTRHLPVTEKLSRTLLSLPIQPEIAMDSVDRIADVVLEYLRK
ncbi:DegT/DnrJ/EryC1/StrS family aminotransferase [Tardiphaga sp. vice304]|uniref:DegT/DnrJ/EryC1/StrS family aminotransferase n=1 Tax=Tardiphaga sp. vice304 TaxID=2592817 RepID=UPI001165706A|nr:DegT/DnrJ/EryC1/StrS family aminotransferase [Tardiphaga sp. vice304]QDM28155.1 DegT/DnrJ/EryC1/StrS family aminotransferase [Tardiphaga sp. vice304]